MSRSFTATIRKAPCPIHLTSAMPAKVWGSCNPPDKEPLILLNSRLGDFNLMRTAIHEVIHRWDWDLKEEAVDELAEDISNVLTMLGYKRDSKAE